MPRQESPEAGSTVSNSPGVETPATMPQFTRRSFLRVLGGGIVTGLWITNRQVSPAQAEAEKPQPNPEDPFSRLTNLSDKINQLASADVPSELSTSIKELTEKFTEKAQRRFQRIEKLTELAVRRPEGDPAAPSLTELYGQSLGAIDSIPLKKIVPFLQDKTKLEGILTSVQNQVDAVLASPRQGSIAENKLKVLEMSLTRQLADRLFLFAEDYQNKPDVEIKPHPDIDLSSEGKVKFEQYQKVIQEYLKKHPNAKKLVDQIMVHSSSFGDLSQEPPEGIGGLFNVAFVGVERPIIQLELFLNHLPGEKDIEAILDHEMMGHGTDIEVNRLFADQLPEEEEIQLLRLKYLSLLNPQCSPILTDIPQLFDFPQERINENPASSNDDQIYIVDEGSAEGVEFKSTLLKPLNFVDSIKFYPIMNALFGHIQKINSRKSLLQEIYSKDDPVKGEPGSQPQAKTDILVSKPFNSLRDFIEEYLPILSKETKTSSYIDPKVISWALENYPEEFSKYPFLGDLSTAQGKKYTPRQGDKGEVWLNYCNLVVVNAALIHLLFNDTPEAREMIIGNTRQILEDKVFQRVRGARNEAYAEGMAKSALIGDDISGVTFKDTMYQVNLSLAPAA